MQPCPPPPADPATPTARERMLAGLARPMQHELNNLLMVVFANLDMLRRATPEGAPLRQLERTQEAARRIDAATRALCGLLGRPPAEVARLSEVLAGLQPLLALLLPAPGALSLAAAVEDPPVRLDRWALEQALLALAKQAAAALPRGGGLRLALAPAGVGVALAITRPAGMELPALALLAGVASAAGGGAETVEAPPGAVLTLHFPAAPAEG